MDDRTDAMKPDALERESWWSTKPVVHMVRRVAPVKKASTDPGYEAGSPQALALANGAQAGAAVKPAVRAEEFGQPTVFADWTPGNLAAHEEMVEVYSNCASVELALNGVSLGAKPRNKDDSARKWTVAFASGTLKASCGDGKTAETLKTAGAAVSLKLTVERGKIGPDFDDVGYVRARVVDKDGTVVPDAATMLHFSASGGSIVATDNGDNAYVSPFQSPDRMPLRGSAIAIVRGTGEVRVMVKADGLRGDEVLLKGAK